MAAKRRRALAGKSHAAALDLEPWHNNAEQHCSMKHNMQTAKATSHA